MPVVFTHIDPDTGINTSWDITGLSLWVIARMDMDKTGDWQRGHLFKIAIDREMAEHYARLRGIEPHRYKRLTRECAKTPVIFCRMADGTVNLVDGNHRYVWLARHGFDTVLGFVLSEAEWKPYEVKILDRAPLTQQDVDKMKSGIK